MKTALLIIFFIFTLYASTSQQKSEENLTLSETIDFTDAELSYLMSKKSISMCYAKEHAPYTMMEHGQPLGVSIDVLRIIEKKIGVPFEFVYADTLSEQFKMIKDKLCQSVPAILTSPQIIPFLKATIPAGKDTLTMVTKIEEPYIFDMATLGDKKIGIDKQSVNIVKFVRENYPDMNYVEVDGTDLEKIMDDEVYAFIGPSVKMNYLISVKYKNKLKVMRTLDDSEFEGSIGVHVDEPSSSHQIHRSILWLAPYL